MIFAVVLVSANSEWRIVRSFYSNQNIEKTPYGECFHIEIDQRQVVFVQGGWGKIAAAASAQYAVSRWQPQILVNLGTCGGFEGRIERGALILAERTLVYDIIEQMGDAQEAIDHYTVDLDLSWLREPYPQPVIRGLLVSGDRDLCPQDIPMLVERYHARAGDWESGAIAFVASRNHLPCLILRGVTDLVNEQNGEAYGNIDVFHSNTQQVMLPLLQALPGWLRAASEQ